MAIQNSNIDQLLPWAIAVMTSKPWPENSALMSVVKAQKAEVRPIVDRLLILMIAHGWRRNRRTSVIKL